MKFGKTLLSNQIPEWSRYYILYKTHKRLISDAKALLKEKGLADLSTQDAIHVFWKSIDVDLIKVNTFFLNQHERVERRLRVCRDRLHQYDDESFSKYSAESHHAFLDALKETRDLLHMAIRYSDTNYNGFRKIAKKFDKKLGQQTLKDFLVTKVDVLEFSKTQDLNSALNEIEVMIIEAHKLSVKIEQKGHGMIRRMSFTWSSHNDLISALSSDNLPELIKILDEPALAGSAATPALSVYTPLLIKACHFSSPRCVAYLLQKGGSVAPEAGDVNERTLVHRLVVHGGVLATERHSSRHRGDETGLIETVLNTSTEAVEALFQVDGFGRTPLHYSTLLNLPRTAKLILERMRTHRARQVAASPILDPSNLIDLKWCDYDGQTPVFYAVVKGHAEVLKALVDSESFDLDAPIEVTSDSKIVQLSNRTAPLKHVQVGTTPLGLACTYGHAKVVKLLLDYGADVDAVNEDEETPLHLSCRGGWVDCVRILIGDTSSSDEFLGANIHATEKYFGWTALHIAAIQGFAECVELLLDAGANVFTPDISGWNPYEYAVFRGHSKVKSLFAPYLDAQPPKPPFPSPQPTITKTNPIEDDKGRNRLPTATNTVTSSPIAPFYPPVAGPSTPHTSSADARSASIVDQAKPEPSAPGSAAASVSERSCLKNESVIVIHLGSLDMRHPVEPVVLDEAKIPATLASTSYVLSISCQAKAGQNRAEYSSVYTQQIISTSETVSYDLPLHESVQDAAVFHQGQAPDGDDDTIIHFEIRPTFGGATPKLVGRASAPLKYIVATPLWNDENQVDVAPVRHEHTHDESSHLDDSARGDDESVVTSSERHYDHDHDLSSTFVEHDEIASVQANPYEIGLECKGPTRRSQSGRVTIPIVCSDNLAVIGRVTFEFVIVNPIKTAAKGGPSTALQSRTPEFFPLEKPWTTHKTIWGYRSTQVIGHRGCGANRTLKELNRFQLGENTILSLSKAGDLGATYVEFDVQLSKDNIPVLYHDWTVSESGFELPVNSFTLYEFLNLRDRVTPSRNNRTPRAQHPLTRNPKRSRSVGDRDQREPRDIPKLSDPDYDDGAGARYRTRSKLPWPYKGNGEGTIMGPFATLREALRTVPKSIGFNIEIKYPNLEEAEECNLQFTELNQFVDIIVSCVLEEAASRDIIFSSFHPEACLMANLKQSQYPVFFLTDAGVKTNYDARLNSLRNAIRLAHTAGLAGIVSNVQPIVEAPTLVRAVREQGLLLFTYGGANNEPTNTKMQRAYGVDAVIVDDVSKIVRGFS
ncbi:Glycerophosphoryl diester phosphodiesterase family-domain-containing protein [Polychytrium aggregatum]|uniref:Glycerophosphoryl diester phosphodiesterase family-domain-containing protein n=1 Tax=Polychytrium aggregatum TaxID=110093 RepID=UPI0022FE0D35|nr:Glycerophosphoryl diester phosphodiesterase family-domain-containing protein [Polychytrium aggregatum]KAI9190800.1 Glycerophosphoryl diester phosphodiesterase family-domain-containing protein [Polychytrium aggregatum]